MFPSHDRGLVKLIGAASPVNGNPDALTIAGGISTTPGDANNIIEIFGVMATLMPEDIMDADDLKLFCGMDTFLTYQKAVQEGNYFHYVVDQDFTGELPLVGFPNVTVCATPGLSGLSAKNCYLLRASNIYIGVDLPEEESNDVRSWYDENQRIYKVTMAFREIVTGKQS